MKKSRIERIIKRDMKIATPDILGKIDGIDRSISLHNSRPSFLDIFKSWRVRSMLVATSILIGLAVIFVAQIDRTTLNEYVLFDNDKDVFTIAALTSIGLLEQKEHSIETGDFSNDSVMPLGLNFSHIDQLSQHIALIEPIIQDKNTMRFTYIDSPLEDFDTMVIFTSNDLRFQLTEFTLHFSITIDQHNNTVFDGLVLLSKSQYVLTGTFFKSNKPLKAEFTITNPDVSNTVMTVKHNIIDKGQTYLYEYSSNATIERSTISFKWDKTHIVTTVNLVDDQVAFTLTKERTGFMQKLLINYAIDKTDSLSDSIVMKVVYNTSISKHQYQFTTYQNNQPTIINISREVSSVY